MSRVNGISLKELLEGNRKLPASDGNETETDTRTDTSGSLDSFIVPDHDSDTDTDSVVEISDTDTQTETGPNSECEGEPTMSDGNETERTDTPGSLDSFIVPDHDSDADTDTEWERKSIQGVIETNIVEQLEFLERRERVKTVLFRDRQFKIPEPPKEAKNNAVEMIPEEPTDAQRPTLSL